MGKARKFSPEFKAQVVLEIVSGRKSLALASREYQIKNTVLSRWKAQFLEGAPVFSRLGVRLRRGGCASGSRIWSDWRGNKPCNWKLQKSQSLLKVSTAESES